METTPTSREKDTSGREEWHEEDKRKVKKLYSSFLPVRVLTGIGGWGGGGGMVCGLHCAVYGRVKEIWTEESTVR